MKRKYFSALLMGALTIASVSTFTSCKDYDDDISNLQQQIDSNAKAIETIQNLIKGRHQGRPTCSQGKNRTCQMHRMRRM
jgi:peptidoglycan hydrolase CwlO-like protein